MMLLTRAEGQGWTLNKNGGEETEMFPISMQALSKELLLKQCCYVNQTSLALASQLKRPFLTQQWFFQTFGHSQPLCWGSHYETANRGGCTSSKYQFCSYMLVGGSEPRSQRYDSTFVKQCFHMRVKQSERTPSHVHW